MKKPMSILLAMFMLISQLSVVFAEEAIAIPAKFEDWYLNNFVVKDGNIYSAKNKYIVQYDEAKKEFMPIAIIEDEGADEWVGYDFYIDNDEILTFKYNDLSFCKVEIEGQKATLIPKYDLTKAGFEKEKTYPNQMALTDNYIYVSYYDPDAGIEKLARINKSDMQIIDIPIPENTYLQELKAYKNDMVYFIGYEEANKEIRYIEGEEFKTFATIPETGSNIANVNYNKFNDKFYVFDQNFAYTIDANAQMEKVAFVNVPEYTGRNFLDAETFYYFDTNELKSIKFTGQKLPEQFIKVMGLEDMRIIKKYNELNPTNPAIRVSGYMSDVNTAANSMKSADAADVYFFESYTNLETLYKHEYLHSLSSSEKINAAVDRMYPYIQKAVKFDGEVYLLPFNMYNYGSMAPINRYAYNEEAFKDMGLTEADVPQTYSQFIDMIERWQNEFSVEYKDYEFVTSMQFYNMFWQLTTRILNTVNLTSIKNGETPNYNTPNIQELFAKLEATDFYGFYDPKENTEYEYSEKKAMFSETEGLIDLTRGYIPFTLKIDENSEPINMASMTAVAVNELSTNKDNAMAFVEYVLENLGQKNQTLLYTDVNDPVKYSDYDKGVERAERRIEELKAEIEKDKAEGGKKQKLLEEELGYLEKDLEWYQNNMYDLSEEEIKLYNEMADTFVVITSNVFDYTSEQINVLLQRYFDKNISSQEFLTELDRYIKMMTL
ncbi:MAG: hypothetical protein GYA87_10210, partial [Christensenellaceae bacterium]|nr:hypothetical protein [Christensenellaceae bacterium]